MNSIPLFDSLTHPTPDGTWLDARFNGFSTADELRRQMDAAEIANVMAVGMGKGVGGYCELKYAEWVRAEISAAYPVAYCNPMECVSSRESMTRHFRSVKHAGYVGIKLHPRMGNFKFCDSQVADVICAAKDAGLFSMICTYGFGNKTEYSEISAHGLMTLLNALENDVRLILLHGGLTNILEWSEALRSRPNVLLDLSFTLLRFEGSSLDLDIQFLFNTFDQRICVGSDHPQYSLLELRRRFDHFAGSVSLQKAQNIGYANLRNFLDGEES